MRVTYGLSELSFRYWILTDGSEDFLGLSLNNGPVFPFSVS
jgi:hypothetical protein